MCIQKGGKMKMIILLLVDFTLSHVRQFEFTLVCLL